MKKIVLLLVILCLCLTGCTYTYVDQGCIARQKTVSGWGDKLYGPGTAPAWGRDQLYCVDTTEDTREVKINILVGGKVNLTMTVQVRYAVSRDQEKLMYVLENIPAKAAVNSKGEEVYLVGREDLFKRYVEPVVRSKCQAVLSDQPSVEIVLANLPTLIQQVRAAILEEIKDTPVQISMLDATDYDWPEEITKQQIELASIELEERKQEARVRAQLKEAEGKLKIEEANLLVEAKKAEGVAMGIRVVKDELKGCPEYLQWHTVRAMSEAATGQNNAFILFPYNMPGMEGFASQAVDTALLRQVLTAPQEEGQGE